MNYANELFIVALGILIRRGEQSLSKQRRNKRKSHTRATHSINSPSATTLNETHSHTCFYSQIWLIHRLNLYQREIMSLSL